MKTLTHRLKKLDSLVLGIWPKKKEQVKIIHKPSGGKKTHWDSVGGQVTLSRSQVKPAKTRLPCHVLMTNKREPALPEAFSSPASDLTSPIAPHSIPAFPHWPEPFSKRYGEGCYGSLLSLV
jgi:hypothetical protein